jgi:enoyl-[acyl-carrier protein] reductase III
MEPSFAGKIALVTGSSRGIGRAVALYFARRGADVIVNFFRNREPAEAAAAEIRSLGQRAEIIKADIGKEEGIHSLFDQVERIFGALDIYVGNAASGYNRPVLQQRQKGWDWTMNINARSLLFSAQRLVPLMDKRGGGAIVSITSPGSQRVLPDYSVVGASKAALEALTRYLAVELASHEIIVNAVSPGVVKTEALEHFAFLQDPQMLDHLAQKTPAGRMVSPEDVAEVVGFLCSPAACMIRGQVITVDGGYFLLGG